MIASTTNNEALRKRIEEIDDRLRDLVKHSDEIHRQLRRMYDGGRLITYKDLSQVNTFQPFSLAEGVSTYRIPCKSARSLFFITSFSASSTLRRHYHDCTERVSLLSGDLLDTISLKNIYTCVEYKPYEPHEFYSPDGCTLLVEIYDQ